MPGYVARLQPPQSAPAKGHAGTFHRASNQGGCPTQFSFDSRARQPRSGERPFYCPVAHRGGDQDWTVLEACCRYQSFRRCASRKSGSGNNPAKLNHESASSSKRSPKRPGSVAPRSIWGVNRPSGSLPKSLFSCPIVLTAFHVGSVAGGRRPAVILALHAVEIQAGSALSIEQGKRAATPGRLRTGRSQPDDPSIAVHFRNRWFIRLSSRSRYGSVQDSSKF